MSSTIDWWNSLNHNWKKNILVNFEFNERWANQFNKIANEIIFRKPYNALFLNFDVRVRAILNNFVVSEDSINKLLQIKCFVVHYEGLKDLKPLQKFSDLEFLSISGDLPGLNELLAVKNMRVLRIAGGKLTHLTSISKWLGLEEISMTYCYNIENLMELASCLNLKVARITYIGKVVDLSPLQNLQEIHVNKNQFHCDDSYYNKKFNNIVPKPIFRGITKYHLDDFEIALIKNSDNLAIKENYNSLIKNSRFEIILNGYSEWILKKKI